MKKKFTFTLVLTLFVSIINAQTPCIDGMAGGYPCDNVDLWNYMSMSDLGGGSGTSDVWGWTDSHSKREFALVGKTNGTAFVEITNPANPVYLGTLDTHTSTSTWRDIKVYQDHAFIVSEAGGHGMQVFELTQLLTVTTPQDFSESAYYDGFGHSHNVAINEETGFAYSVGDNTFSAGLHIVDLSDPINPTLAGGFSASGYTHDCQAVVYHGPDTEYQGKEIVFAANEDHFAIVDVEDKTDCELVSSTYYEDDGYTHQCWLTPDHKFLLFGDELDELYDLTENTRTYVYNVEDLDNPYQVAIYEGPSTSIDHNLYTQGNLVFQSNYTSGLRILDAGGIETGNIIERGFFDTYPANDDASFDGTWSNFPYFPSGNVIITDGGLFIVKPQILSLEANAVQVDCANETATFDLTINTELSSNDFSLSLEGLPGSPTISGTTISAPGSTTITISNITGLTEEITNFQIVLNSDYAEYIVPATLLIDLPSVSIINPSADMYDICTNNGESIDWETETGVTYEIIISPNSDLSAPIVQEMTDDGYYSLNVEIIPEGEYYWAITATNECGSLTSPVLLNAFFICFSIDEQNLSNVNVFPNPTNGKITLSGIESKLDLNITDITGRIVWEMNEVNNATVIDISHLTQGVYLLKTSNNITLQKIVKE